MTFSEFADDLLVDIQTFITYWKQRNAANPEHFPMEMEPGDWDEQFRAYLDSRHR